MTRKFEFSDYRRADRACSVWNTKKVEWRERNEVKVENFWCNTKATRPGLNIEYLRTKPAYFIFPFLRCVSGVGGGEGGKKKIDFQKKLIAFFPHKIFLPFFFFFFWVISFFSLNFPQSRRHCFENNFQISFINLSIPILSWNILMFPRQRIKSFHVSINFRDI